MNKPINKGSFFMFLLLLYNIAMQLIISAIYYYFHEDFNVGFFFTPGFAVFSQVLSFLLPLGIWLALTKDRLSENLPSMRLGKINIILIIAISFFLQPAMMLLSALTSFIFPNPVAETLSYFQDYPYIVLVIAVALTPAFCEEVTFRGYIQHQYRHVNIKKAAWINGLFFGMMHLNAHQFPYALLMGVVLAYFVYFTRSIRAGMLAHFCVNFFQVTISALMNAAYSADSEAELASDADMELMMWRAIAFLAIIALIFMGGAIPLFATFLHHNRQRNIRHDMKEVLESTDKITIEKQPDGAETVNEQAQFSATDGADFKRNHDDTPPQEEKAKAIDIYFWLVIVFYLLFLFLFH